MVESGDHVLPTFGGEPRLDKPPMFVWAGAMAARALGGVNEFTLRIPSALSACVCILAAFLIGIRLFDVTPGLLAALILSTTGRFLLYAQWVSTDLMVATLITCAIAAWIVGIHESHRDEGRLHSVLAGQTFMLFSAFAVLTKGPVGIVLPVGIAGAWLLLSSVLDPARGLPVAAATARGWLLGLPLFALITVPWYLLLGARAGPEAVSYSLLHQNVNRFVDAWNAQQPWHYYFKALPLDLLPWSLFFVAAIVLRGGAPADRRERDSWWLLLCWFTVVFVFFSLASGKSPEYLLPLLPAAALMTARGLVLGSRSGLEAGAGRLPGGALRLRLLRLSAGLPLAAAVAGMILIPIRGGRQMPGSGPALLLAMTILLAGSAGAFAALLRRRAMSGAVILGGGRHSDATDGRRPLDGRREYTASGQARGAGPRPGP
jgi:4-amino-4-deoxy-L-arabinose transferase-like glycosyltransferase